MAAVTVGAAYGGWRLSEAWRYRTALAEIREQIQAGRHAIAARNLFDVLEREPGSDEAAYLLGLCEKARGRTDAADEAWGRVPPASRFAPSAITGRAAILVDRGRFADAERLLTGALSDPRIDGFELRRFLTPLYWQEGRVAEARRLVEANWEVLNRSGRGGSDQAIELVRLHIAMGVGTASAESVRDFLDRAERLAPGRSIGSCWVGPTWRSPPGRVRRGGAPDRGLPAASPRRCSGLAGEARVGDGDRAGSPRPERRSTICRPPSGTRRSSTGWRPGSPPVGETSHAERRALEKLTETDPADGAAFDRLAELAVREGQPARAAELRRRKAELDQKKAQYQELLLRDQPVRDAAKMAALAEQLGHWFEAKVFASVALATEPGQR